MNTPLYFIELRASHFESPEYLELLAAKGLVTNQPMVVVLGKVPVVGDVLNFGNLDVEIKSISLIVNPRTRFNNYPGPVARAYVRVKP